MSEQEMIARALFQRFKERAARRLPEPQPGSYALAQWESLPASFTRDFYEDATAILTTLASRTPEGMVMVPREPTEAHGRAYLADRFEWAAPGDQQEDAWLVRFCDKDCGEAIFTGPEAASEAAAHWDRYAPSFNIYVFRLARLNDLAATPTPSGAE